MSVFVVTCFPFDSLGQNKSGGIKGRILNEYGEKVPFATIMLQQSDSLITITKTDFEGKFRFQNLAKGVYDLEITALGYLRLNINENRIAQGIILINGKVKHNPNHIRCYIKSSPRIIHPEHPNHQMISGEELRSLPAR